MPQFKSLIAFLFVLASTSTVHAMISEAEHARIIKCAAFRSDKDPQWVDLDAAVDLLNISAKPNPINKTEIATLDSKNLNRAVQARIKVLKSLLNQAGEVQSAELLLENFEQLNNLPERINKPELLDRGEAMAYIGMAKADVGGLYRDLFALTVIAVANRQPFVILNDTRVIPIIAEALFSRFRDLELSPLLPKPDEFRQHRSQVIAKLDDEKLRLSSGTALRLSASFKAGADVWQEQLDMISEWEGITLKDVNKFADHLKIDFVYNAP